MIDEPIANDRVTEAPEQTTPPASGHGTGGTLANFPCHLLEVLKVPTNRFTWEPTFKQPRPSTIPQIDGTKWRMGWESTCTQLFAGKRATIHLSP